MVAEKDRLIFKSLAISLTPFAASQATFKILAENRMNRISCDPAEILDAYDPGDSLPLALLREAVQGISHFGRRAQARLVLLGAALLDELPHGGGLRRATDLAHTALQKLGIAKTQGLPETAFSGEVIPARQPEDKKAPNTKFNDLLLGDISDDVSWFFSTDVGEQLDVTYPLSTEADLNAIDVSTALHRPGGSLGDGESICSVSDELCRRCAAATALDKSGSGAGQQCFVYGRIRPVQPRMTLRDGIVCHVPHGYIAARGSALAKLVDMDGATKSKAFKTIFLDADLTSSAYASCAPAQRRLKEQLVQSTVTGEAQPVNFGVLFASEEHDKLLVENLHSLKSRGFEAVMLSGDFSEAVASASCDIGLLVAGGIPARLIHALAADCGAEVLHGLPDCGTFSQSLDIFWMSREEWIWSLETCQKVSARDVFAIPCWVGGSLFYQKWAWQKWMVFGKFGRGLKELKQEARICRAQYCWKQAVSPKCDKASRSWVIQFWQAWTMWSMRTILTVESFHIFHAIGCCK